MSQAAFPSARGDYEAITNTNALENKLDTSRLFFREYEEDKSSPIDKYIRNSNKINLVWINEGDVSPELASIVLLGYLSAVESYMRSLIRAVINVDPTCQSVVESKTISFAAAVHHKKSILPEALLEDISFAGSDNVRRSLNNFLGLPQQKLDNMSNFFDEFDKISQLRHCCTHRFGRLGTKNAMALGLSDHTGLLEKPLHLSVHELSIIAENLRNFVKSLNNNIFRVLLERTVVGVKNSGSLVPIKIEWRWSYKEDRKIFYQYYKVFSSKLDSAPSPSPKDMYERFRLAFTD